MNEDQARALAHTVNGSPTQSRRKSVRETLQDRLTLSEAVIVASRMVACFPNGGQTSGKSYMGALAAILVTYPAMIARLSADPVKGVPRETKFLPTPADVIAWCERELTSMRKSVDHGDHFDSIKVEMDKRRADDDYWQKARKARPTLNEMRAHYGPDWGITQPQRKVRPYQSLTDDDLRKLYPRRDDHAVEKRQVEKSDFR